MRHRLLLALLLLTSGSASALDKSDEGVFALVHKDGRVTQKIARFSQVSGRWHLEDRLPDGKWEDVTCEDACSLQETTPQQVEQFLRGTALEGGTLDCVHDQAFAFCRADTPHGNREYYMLAFSDGMVIPLKWVRLNASTLEPVGAP